MGVEPSRLYSHQSLSNDRERDGLADDSWQFQTEGLPMAMDHNLVQFRSVLSRIVSSDITGNTRTTVVAYQVNDARQHTLSCSTVAILAAGDYWSHVGILTGLIGPFATVPVLMVFGSFAERLPQGWEWVITIGLAFGLVFFWALSQSFGWVIEKRMEETARQDRGISNETFMSVVRESAWEDWLKKATLDS